MLWCISDMISEHLKRKFEGTIPQENNTFRVGSGKRERRLNSGLTCTREDVVEAMRQDVFQNFDNYLMKCLICDISDPKYRFF